MREHLWIGGEWQPSASGQTFDVKNPATGEVLARVAAGDAPDVARAVAAARTASRSDNWRNLSPRRRADLLWKLAELIEQNADELATLETLNNGKPIFESREIDLPDAVATFRYYAGAADKVEGLTVPVEGPFLNYTLREPLGVVGCIIPWNFPLSLASWKLAPALACGNVVVLKPAEETPLTALRLAELAHAAGFPPGVVNVVPGFGATAGAALVRHPDVNAISFTGSTEVGRTVMSEASATLKKVSLELGGKSPNIVFADADLAAAVKGTAAGIFYGKGEVCSAGSRILVQESIAEEFTHALVQRAAKLRVGDPLDPQTRLGAIVSESQLERVLQYIEAGRRDGARLLCGGERVSVHGRGNFVTAAVFDRVDPSMSIAREEIFGPVAVVLPFRDLADAIAKANETIYGLAAGIWTRDIGKAHRLASEIQAGTIWINTYNRFDSGSPFGGYKQSGFGRDLGYQSAIEAYTQVKSVWVAMTEVRDEAG